MIRTLIIEDEPDAAMRLEKMLISIEPALQVLAKLDSVEATVNWLQNNRSPDLMMLDIQLGDGLSFDIFRKFRVDCFVIFTTAYDEYAIKAFELNSIDYLLKPIDGEKLRISMDKYHRLRAHPTKIETDKIMEMLQGRKDHFKKRFLVGAGEKLKSIDIGEIAFFYSLEKITFLVTHDDLHYPVEFSLDHLETLLDQVVFFRVSRQYIVNIRAIRNISILSKSRIRLATTPPVAEGVMVSSSRTHELRKWLDR